MIDCGFPIIEYEANQSATERGRLHGEEYRDAIKELVEIRTSLMREKNAGLDQQTIDRLALEQWEFTLEYHTDLGSELQGIVDGSGASITDIVILNNYTDFRDIQIDDQGCSLAYVNVGNGPIVGQTWDMHGSAKNYVCCISIPDSTGDGKTIAFSVVGCVGMMGFNSKSAMLGVNNINTDGAKSGVMWPVIVRATLQAKDLTQMADCLIDSPKTSGHNYLIAQRDQAQMWEVAPGCNDQVDSKAAGETGYMFHTNHCLGKNMAARETKISQNSTTHIRFDLLEKKIGSVRTLDEMFALMNDHENYPKSICSNFQTDSQDPSITCGGAVGNLESGEVVMWRGDQLYDENFVLHRFNVTPS